VAAPGRWTPWLPLAGLYVAALAVRSLLVGAQPNGDEAAHYYVARTFGGYPAGLEPAMPEFTRALFWQRPLFSLLLAPFAWSFGAYQAAHAALASLLPVLAVLLARRAGAGRLAWAAGLLLAFHPTLVLWGVRVFPDSLMAVLALGGILAGRERPLLSAALLVAATWTKETGAVALAAMAGWSLWLAVRSGEAGLWPLRLDRPATAYAGALLLAPLPLLYAVMGLGGRAPGWSQRPFDVGVLDTVLLSAWLLLPLAAGLAQRAARPWCLLALAPTAFYVAYSLAGRGVEAWYAVLPASLAAVACSAALAPLARRAVAAAPWRPPGPARSAVAALLLLPLALPSGLLTPLSATEPEPLPDLVAAARTQRDLERTVAEVAARQPQTLFLADVGWFYALHPFGEMAPRVSYGLTEFSREPEPWARLVERSNVTVLARDRWPLNLALAEVYADCVVAQHGPYLVIEGAACPGRVGRLPPA
jgi:hypothetical protein